MAELPSKDKLLGYVGIAAGFGVGYLISGLFLHLSSRIWGFLNGVMSGTKRASGAVGTTDWKDMVARLLALLFWGIVAVAGFTKFRKDDGPMFGFVLGLGLGGLTEELMCWANGTALTGA